MVCLFCLNGIKVAVVLSGFLLFSNLAPRLDYNSFHNIAFSSVLNLWLQDYRFALVIHNVSVQIKITV